VPAHVFKGTNHWLRKKGLKRDDPNGLTTSEAIAFINHNLPEADHTSPAKFLSWDLLDPESPCYKKDYQPELETNLYSPLALYLKMHAYLKAEVSQTPS
jgi:hypothetical protein